MDFTSKDKVLRLLEQAAASLDGSTGEVSGSSVAVAALRLACAMQQLK